MRNKVKTEKKYLIALEETRSVTALIAGVIIVLCALASVFVKLEDYSGTGEHPLHYFTVLSNLLSAAAAAFMIPYAAEGIRKKRFVLPRWVVLLQYAGAVCLAVTMIASLCIIWPVQGSGAVTGSNFWLHVVTPALTVLLFQCVETGAPFGRRDAAVSLIPLLTYTAVYFVMVVPIGEERGGWSDFYMTAAFWPGWVSALMITAVGITASALLLLLHNKRAAQSLKRITRAWSEDLEPTQLLIEAFGLGRYIGARCGGSELTIPLDIFGIMSEKYGIPPDRLTKAYVKGALDAVKEKKEN